MRKSGASGLPKGGGTSSRGRPGSAISKTKQRKVSQTVVMQLTSYQYDACELMSNRINKKLREWFTKIKDFASYREKA